MLQLLQDLDPSFTGVVVAESVEDAGVVADGAEGNTTCIRAVPKGEAGCSTGNIHILVEDEDQAGRAIDSRFAQERTASRASARPVAGLFQTLSGLR